MRVDQPRGHGAAAEVDDPGSLGDQRGRPGIRSEVGNPAVTGDEGALNAARSRYRVEHAVAQHEVAPVLGAGRAGQESGHHHQRHQ